MGRICIIGPTDDIRIYPDDSGAYDDFKAPGQGVDGWQLVKRVQVKQFFEGPHKRVNIYFGASRSFRSDHCEKRRNDEAHSRLCRNAVIDDKDT